MGVGVCVVRACTMRACACLPFTREECSSCSLLLPLIEVLSINAITARTAM
jgi:hypothetical protein